MARSIIFFVVFALFQLKASGQVEKPVNSPKLNPPKESQIPKDAKSVTGDTSKIKKDSVTTKKGDIESTILYTAHDSIISSLDTKIVRLYGNAKVTYGKINLDAEEIIIDYEKSIITANGKKDSTGKMIGFPVFNDGNNTYETKGMIYNFKSKKARITEVVTKEGEGFMHGEKVYKNEKNDIFAIGNAYTTCDLADPHYRIISKKAKAIQGDKIVTGPFYMEFNHVPTPLGFAFGMFPSQKQAQSGIIVPAYGEEQIRGFFLKGAGYYFHLSDYMNLSVRADLYSKGSTGLYLNSAYISRYKYSGNLAFTYNNNVRTQEIEKPIVTKDFSLTWSHSPRSKGNSRFSASVNAATSTNNSNNLLGIGQTNNPQLQNSAYQRNASSNISFSKTFPGTPVSVAMNMRHSQDFSTRKVNLALPDISLNVNNVYPIKKAKARILQNLQFKYTMTATNQINNDLGNIAKNKNGTFRDSIGAFNLQNLPIYFQNANKGIKHTIPISTSFKLLKYYTITASANYTELWYFDKLKWGPKNPDPLSFGSATVKTDTIHQFNREAFYNLSLGLTTRIYGTRLAKNKDARIRAIRHLITPSIGFTYSPDFSAAKYGYYQKVPLTDGKGRPYTVLKSVHEGYVYGQAPLGRSETMSFGIGNTLEMKVRKPKDTVDRKIAIFNNLSLSSSYNFLADSFKLAPIGMTGNTNVLNGKLSINIGATLDPYQYRYRVTGTDSHDVPIKNEFRTRYYSWNAGEVGRITTANLAFSTNLNPKGQKKDNEMREKIAKSNATQADKDYLMKHPDMYVDFSIPWELRLSYNVTYNRSTGSASITQSANFSGNVSLSEKWKITYNSGYDFANHAITMTSLGLQRDLHCWQMSLNWVPFGKFQSYTFNIGIKSSLLKDLKLNRTRSFVDSQSQ